MIINCRTTLFILALIFLSGSVVGCKEEAPPPAQKPAVVSRKIDAKPKPAPAAAAKPAAPKATPAAKTEPAPAAKPEPAPAAVSQKEAVTPPPVDTAAQPAEPTTEKAAPVTAADTAGETESTPTMEEILGKAAEQGLYRARFYRPEGKIDPFAPLFQQKAEVKKAVTQKSETQKRVPQTPLEKISLEQLKLVGIIQMASGNKALVEEASGRGYVVKKGTYIGLNGGHISRIGEDRIVIEEEQENLLGKITTVEKELTIEKPLGE